MNNLDFNEVREFVNANITSFHADRIRVVSMLKLKSLIEKNPYLSKAKNVTKASELIEGAMAAFLSSSEEKMFGDFLEDLAIFVAEKTTGGHKSGAQGVDLEFTRNGCHYFISIKSGPNWGNSSQHRKLGEDLRNAAIVFRQRRGQATQADTILGICYGKTKTARNQDGYLKLVGQNFWTFISGDPKLFKDIIEPIGYRAKEHNDNYATTVGNITNQLTAQFIEKFCDQDGAIRWDYLIEANSGNYDLDKHGLQPQE